MYINNYAPPPAPVTPPDIHLHTPPEAYDFNFCLNTQPIRVLEGPGRDIKLEPLVVSPLWFLPPSLDGKLMWDVISQASMRRGCLKKLNFILS